jgi:hypothetical protein
LTDAVRRPNNQSVDTVSALESTSIARSPEEQANE